MATQITAWRPDTCECEIQFSWDDSIPSESRVHTLHSLVTKCAFHSALSDQSGYDAVKDENIIKNSVLGHVLETYPTLVDVAADGSKELKDGIEYEWSFDVNRKLQADFTGVDKATAQAIQASVDLEIGADKVDVKIP